MQLPEQEFAHTLDYAIPLMLDERADVFVFPTKTHQKFQPRHKLAAYERNRQWFLFWLRDFKDINPVRVDQYEYWQKMKAKREAASD